MAKKIRILAPVVVALLLLMALVPTAALAVDEGVTEGSVGCGNSTPTFSELSLTHADDSAITDKILTPFWSSGANKGYKLSFKITDNNKLDDISEINVYVHYDANADDATGDVGTPPLDTNIEAKMTWVPSTFSMSLSGTTTWPSTGEWAIDATNSDEPNDLTATQGTWLFIFQISKVATEESTAANGWDVYIEVNDGGATNTWDNSSLIDYKMEAYREISVDPGTVSFGSVNPGSTDNPASGTPYPIEVTTIANDTHDVQIKSETPWDGPSETIALDNDGSPGEGQFSLQADADETSGSVALGNADWVTNAFADLETGLLIRQSPAGTKVYSRLWLDMGNGVKAETYSGDITYKIV